MTKMLETRYFLFYSSFNPFKVREKTSQIFKFETSFSFITFISKKIFSNFMSKNFLVEKVTKRKVFLEKMHLNFQWLIMKGTFKITDFELPLSTTQDDFPSIRKSEDVSRQKVPIMVSQFHYQ